MELGKGENGSLGWERGRGKRRGSVEGVGADRWEVSEGCFRLRFPTA